MEESSFETLLHEFISIVMGTSMENNISFAKQNDLSMSQIRTMFRLHLEGSCGVSEISEALSISSAAVSQMLDRLVQQDIIVRTESADDRRMKVIVLSEKGSLLIQEYVGIHNQWVFDLDTSLTTEEREKAIELMTMLVDKAKKIHEIPEEPRKNKVCCD